MNNFLFHGTYLKKCVNFWDTIGDWKPVEGGLKLVAGEWKPVEVG